MPKTVKSKQEKTEWRTAHPLVKEFWSKKFWSKKQSWNIFSKKFWQSREAREFLEDVEPVGLQRIAAQAKHTLGIHKELEDSLKKMEKSDDVEVFPRPISGHPLGMLFDPAVLIISPKNNNGQKLINELRAALTKQGIPRVSRVDQLIEAMKDVSGPGYAGKIIVKEKSPSGNGDVAEH